MGVYECAYGMVGCILSHNKFVMALPARIFGVDVKAVMTDYELAGAIQKTGN